MAIKNFVVKNGLTVGVANIDAATGNLVTGNANLGNLAIANFFQGNGNALFNIQGANVVGTVANANYSLYAGTVLTNAQPNITSVGTLSSLAVSGNANVGGILTDNYYYANGQPVDFQQAAGSNTQIQFNNNNDFGASANFTFNTATDTLTVTGNANVTGHVNAANINSGSAALTVTANTNVTNFYANGVVAFPANVTAPTFVGNVAGNITGNIAAAGANTEIQFNDNGLLGGSNAFTFNKTSNVLTVGGNISSQNAQLGNLATANYVNVAQNLAVVANISGGNVAGGNLVSANFVTGTLTTSSQPNITSVGTLSSLDVSGNLGAGNVNGGNLVTANFLAGTLTTAAQPNITSVGNLSSLDVVGNIRTNANVITDFIIGRTTSVTIEATGANSNVFLKPTGVGTVDVWGKIISNVATPVASTDAATKQYVDDVAQGLNVHDAAKAATTGTLATLSSGTVTYNNGTAGVGATLTTTGTYATIDGVNIATVGTRILVKNEANAAHNGVYVYTSSTVLTRADDYNSVPEVEAGDFIFVQDGTAYNDTGWVQTSAVATIGTDPIEFTQFSGAGTYTAGTGLTLNGTQFSISNTAVTAGSYGNGDYVATFTVNQQGQLTAASNTAITANAANLSGTTLNANIVNSSLTSVGTLGNLTVSGNITSGNIYANSGTVGAANLLVGTLVTATNVTVNTHLISNTANFSGNVYLPNIQITEGLVGNTGNFSGNVTVPNITVNANLIGNTANFTGNVYLPNIQITETLVGNRGNFSGNLIVPNITINSALGGNTANFSGNVVLPNIQINLELAGNTANFSGNIVGNANITVGNVNTGQVSANANVTTVQFISNATTGTAPLLVNSQTVVANLNADLLDGYNTATSNTANTVAVRDASGNLAANYFIGNGAFLTGIDTSLIANGNSNVSVAANGNVTVSVAGNTGIAVFTGTGANINGYANITGNLIAGNISATDVSGTTLGGTLTTASQPNITSVGTLGSLSVTGTITGGNIFANAGTVGANLLAGTLTTAAQPNVTSVGNLTSLTIAANGNITMSGVEATLSGANLVSATLLTGTLTTAAQPNVTSIGTLTSLTTSGNAVVGGNVKVQVGITSNRANVAVGAAATVIDQFAPGSWRTAKYIISGSGDDGFQSVEALLVHDGTEAYITIYGSICSNVSSDLINLTSNINGVTGNVTVYANSASDNCYVNLVTSYIKT